VRLATIRLGDRTAAVRVEGDTAVELGVPDVRAVLERGEWRSWAAAIDGPRHPSAAVDHAPLVPNPSKILCVGLNYRSHILEMGRELPTHPTLFAKFADTLMGARDDLVLPAVSDEVDWEAELAFVIGRRVRGAEHDAGGLLGERGEADRAQRAEHGAASRQAADAEERARETVRGHRRPERGCDRRLRRSAHAALVALADLVLGQELVESRHPPIFT